MNLNESVHVRSTSFLPFERVSLRVTTEEVALAVSTAEGEGLQSDFHSPEMSNVVLSAI